MDEGAGRLMLLGLLSVELSSGLPLFFMSARCCKIDIKVAVEITIRVSLREVCPLVSSLHASVRLGVELGACASTIYRNLAVEFTGLLGPLI